MISKVGIIGYGEIGKAIFNVYSDFNYEVRVFDPYLNHNEDISDCDLLNICIPYTESFIKDVNDYIDRYRPKLIVIHSTVAPGTTKQISGNVCHSPVRGLHPNLKEGIKTFVKYIGSENFSVSKKYQQHLIDLRIESYICKNSITSEYAKLLDTTYYGLCIAFHSEVMEICEKNDIEFSEAMTVYNETYNSGYSSLGKNNVIRPVLYPSKTIGGHCVVPNAKILSKYVDSKAVQYILKYE